MKYSTVLLAVGAARAVDISAWNGMNCRSQNVVTNMGTEPYKCYYIGSAASIQAHGLTDDGRSEYEIFSDTSCSDLVGVVKYNNLCDNFNFLSVSLIPPFTGSTKQAIYLPEYGTTEWRARQLKLARDGQPMDIFNTTVVSQRARKLARKGEKLAIRNIGDRYDAEYGMSGIDEADSNDEGTSQFDFANADQANQWGGTVLNRLEAAEARGAVTEYNGAQNVNGRSVNIDLIPAQGTMNQIDNEYVTTGLAVFLNHRLHAYGNQRWQFFRNGVALFTLVFKVPGREL